MSSSNKQRPAPAASAAAACSGSGSSHSSSAATAPVGSISAAVAAAIAAIAPNGGVGLDVPLAQLREKALATRDPVDVLAFDRSHRAFTADRSAPLTKEDDIMAWLRTGRYKDGAGAVAASAASSSSSSSAATVVEQFETKLRAAHDKVPVAVVHVSDCDENHELVFLHASNAQHRALFDVTRAQRKKMAQFAQKLDCLWFRVELHPTQARLAPITLPWPWRLGRRDTEFAHSSARVKQLALRTEPAEEIVAQSDPNAGAVTGAAAAAAALVSLQHIHALMLEPHRTSVLSRLARGPLLLRRVQYEEPNSAKKSDTPISNPRPPSVGAVQAKLAKTPKFEGFIPNWCLLTSGCLVPTQLIQRIEWSEDYLSSSLVVRWFGDAPRRDLSKRTNKFKKECDKFLGAAPAKGTRQKEEGSTPMAVWRNPIAFFRGNHPGVKRNDDAHVEATVGGDFKAVYFAVDRDDPTDPQEYLRSVMPHLHQHRVHGERFRYGGAEVESKQEEEEGGEEDEDDDDDEGNEEEEEEEDDEDEEEDEEEEEEEEEKKEEKKKEKKGTKNKFVGDNDDGPKKKQK